MLRRNSLGFPGLMAQNIALISPTMTAALIVPLTFGAAGNGSWLAYLFGTVMLFFVAANLNQFARRSATSGSMYDYAVRGLGPRAGGLTGWCLIWAYACIGMAGLTGFTVFASALLDGLGVHVSPLILVLACGVIGWTLAYKDVRLSAISMLVIEGASVALILALGAIVLGRHGFALDTAQLTLKGMSFSGLSLGVVLSIFSLVGFESSTAFGDEARNPLYSIPRSVVYSLVLTGAFFVVVSYVEVLGVRGLKQTLDQIGLPLQVLAQHYRVGFLGAPLEVGAMASFFSLFLSCVNAGARIYYALAGQGVFHAAVASAHDRNLTPHVAVTLASIVTAIVPLVLIARGATALTVFGWVGSMGAYGFLGAYALISVASSAYLYRIRELRARHVALSGAALLLLLVPAVGSVYPPPPAPANWFPYLFLAYALAGTVWIVVAGRRRPAVAPTGVAASADLEEVGD